MVSFLVGVMPTIENKNLHYYGLSKTYSMSAVSMKGVSPNSDLKEMKSSWLANVITRLLSSFGTGKRYLRIFDTCVTKTFQLFEQTHRGGKKKKKEHLCNTYL